MLKLTSLSLEDAKRLICAAEAKAKAIGSPSNIAVVDAGGNLLAHVRMDGAQIASISHSINKAFTSLACKLPTHVLGQDAQPGGQLYGVSNTVEGRIITFAGGIPLKFGHDLVGAVGVSGGTAEQDREVGEAAEAVL